MLHHQTSFIAYSISNFSTNMPDSSESSTNEARVPGSGSASSNTSGRQQQQPPQTGWNALVDYFSTHKIEFALAVTRALTVLCTLSYLIGWPGPSANRFKQALLMNAATSSLRLHQRMPPPNFNQLDWTYFMNLLKEDSFHYLAYPLIFLLFSSGSIALALLPCSLYALFHLAVYSTLMLDKISNQDQLKEKVSMFVARYQQSLLHTIALSEVALLPILVISFFTGVVGIVVPLLYYRFLLLRYNSSRNPHLKLLVSRIKTIAVGYTSRFMSR